MEQWQRDVETHRIIYGQTIISLYNTKFTLMAPSIKVRLEAAHYYSELLAEGYLFGLLTESEAIDLLRDRNVWTSDDEYQHKLLTEKLDDMKVGLFENYTHSNNRLMIRRALDKGRAEIARLDNIKHSLDHLTCEGIAAAGKVRYLTGFSLLHESGKPLWQSEEDMKMPDGIVDDVIEYLVKTRLTESDIRDLCKNDPWRSYWSARKCAGRGFIDVCATDLSDEQRYIMMWANLYDSVRENYDCPDDSIIEDDDMFDGWMIKQRREREKDRAKKRGEELISNDKIRNSDEIFIPKDRVDPKHVNAMNDEHAKHTKAQRLAHLRSKGQVAEAEMPDTALRLQLESQQKLTESIRQGKKG